MTGSDKEVWSDDLTDAGLKMLMASGEDRKGADGYGVELLGSGWATARALVRRGLGWIEGGKPNGSDLPGLYFNNSEGVRVLNELSDEEEDGCPYCGLTRSHTHYF